MEIRRRTTGRATPARRSTERRGLSGHGRPSRTSRPSRDRASRRPREDGGERPRPNERSALVTLGGPALACVLAIAAMFLFAWRKDSSQRAHGQAAVERWTDIPEADRGLARWVAEQLHDRAANGAGKELGGLTARARARARFDVSDAHYEEYLHELVVDALADPGIRNNYAWQLVSPGPPKPGAAEEATYHARWSIAHSPPSDPPPSRAARLDTLALALFESGNKAEALAEQRRALEVLPDAPENAKLRADFESRLRRYGG